MIKQDNPILFAASQMKSDKKPYYYQEKAIQELERHFIVKNKKASILHIPTGGGKTFTAVRWLFGSLLHKEYKIVWITHRIDLLLQARQTMVEESSLLKGLTKKTECIIIGGGFARGTTLATAKESVILLSTQTLAKENGDKAMMAFCRRNKNKKIMFVIDEAHHSAANSLKVFIRRNIDKEENFKLLGLTATPTRTVQTEKVVLSNLFGNSLICEISINDLIKAGLLALPKPEKIETHLNLEETYIISEDTKAYFETRHELPPAFLNAIGMHRSRNKLIVDTYVNNFERYGKTLVFAIDILHAETLKREFERHKSIRVAVTYSGVMEHHEIVRQFRDGELDVLINISRLTEGFDDPKIQTVFLTRPTQSEILFSQMIGRGLRGGEFGTKYVNLVSFEDHWNQFTGWLDIEKITTLLDIEEEKVEIEVEEIEADDLEDSLEKEKVVLKPVSYQVVDELYRQIKTLAIPEIANALPFECWPLGWYTLNFDSDPDNPESSLPITRTIIVFSHQKQSWEELCKSIVTKNPTLAERIALYNQCFYDLPNPGVSMNIMDLFIDSCYTEGYFIMPVFFSLKHREEASVEKLAKELYDKNIGGKSRQEAIDKWYTDFPLLFDLYSSIENFTEAVDDATRRISFPEYKRLTIPSGEQYLKIEKLQVIIPETNTAKLVDVFNALKVNRELFPNGYEYNPELEWTHRVMKSYFGMAFLDSNKIKINRILNSGDIEQNAELIEFVIYHEMLHFSVSKNHNAEFRQHENIFPNIVELNSMLDRVGLQFDIDSKYT